MILVLIIHFLTHPIISNQYNYYEQLANFIFSLQKLT
jgi:hypothetical protein